MKWSTKEAAEMRTASKGKGKSANSRAYFSLIEEWHKKWLADVTEKDESIPDSDRKEEVQNSVQ